ncbi:MAG: GNAT family N-acetyltransferase [Silicimonas sp.]|nr:GNAT family N-acetyltransferase [Silicimonas sp.]
MTPEEMEAIHARAMTVPSPWSVETILEFVAGPGGFVVANEKGFALGRVIIDEAELLTLAVDPDAQRKGIGGWCLHAFESEAGRRGARRAFLEVAATNQAARTLYAKAGWREDGVRRGYYHAKPAPIDAITMSKALQSG